MNISLPYATAKKAWHCLKLGKGVKNNGASLGTYVYVRQYEAVHPDGRIEILFLMRDAYNFNTIQNSIIYMRKRKKFHSFP